MSASTQKIISLKITFIQKKLIQPVATLSNHTMMKLPVVMLFSLSITLCSAQDYSLQKIDISVVDASFRGLSVVDDNIAWVSGSNGKVGRTTDGGKTWTFRTVPGFEDKDFRSLYGFSKQKALIANAGSPASILITVDGGDTWKTVYVNSHNDAFFDGMDFWNDDEGLIYGDPIENKMLLLRTRDGGLTWNSVTNAPLLENGEASFAASGTGIRCLPDGKVMICTGGQVSRLWLSEDKGQRWTSISVPVVQKKNSAGIFSFTVHGNTITIVGGDYQDQEMSSDHHFYSTDGGKQWIHPETAVRGYRECVEMIETDVLMAVGPGGIDLSSDNGHSWLPFSDVKGMHVIRKARNGRLVIVAGAKGSMAVIAK